MFIGIDVSKAFLDIYDGSQSERVVNERKAIRTWVRSLKKKKVAQVALESTGSYHLMAVQTLLDGKIPVSIVNAKRVRDFTPRVCFAMPVVAVDWPRPTRLMRKSCMNLPSHSPVP